MTDNQDTQSATQSPSLAYGFGSLSSSPSAPLVYGLNRKASSQSLPLAYGLDNYSENQHPTLDFGLDNHSATQPPALAHGLSKQSSSQSLPLISALDNQSSNQSTPLGNQTSSKAPALSFGLNNQSLNHMPQPADMLDHQTLTESSTLDDAADKQSSTQRPQSSLYSPISSDGLSQDETSVLTEEPVSNETSGVDNDNGSLEIRHGTSGDASEWPASTTNSENESIYSPTSRSESSMSTNSTPEASNISNLEANSPKCEYGYRNSSHESTVQRTGSPSLEESNPTFNPEFPSVSDRNDSSQPLMNIKSVSTCESPIVIDRIDTPSPPKLARPVSLSEAPSVIDRNQTQSPPILTRSVSPALITDDIVQEEQETRSNRDDSDGYDNESSNRNEKSLSDEDDKLSSDSSDNINHQNGCRICHSDRDEETKGEFMGCQYNNEGGDSDDSDGGKNACNYWVHSQCLLGIPLSNRRVRKIPFYCPQHKVYRRIKTN